MRRAFVLALVIAGGATSARASENPRAPGMYPPSGQPLAVVDSKIDVTVRGPIAEAVVTQHFRNGSDRPTEATYIFPLPPDAAVSAMAIRVGNRTIRASIEKREEAQRRYEAAVRAGVGAALLDQERPDIFTQTVAAIPAHATVEVTLRFDTVARFQDGTWELALPLVVAPRYVPGAATGRGTTGSGRAPDTDRAPDASRVTPPGTPGAGGATQVVVHFSDKPDEVTSPTHEIKAAGSGASFMDLRSDHDAIVRWKSAATAAGWVEQDADGGYAAVVVTAPAAQPRRGGSVKCLLVVDRSATARGDADAVSRPVIRAFLNALGPSDRVAVAGSDTIAWNAPADIARVLDQRWGYAAGPFDLTRVLATARPEGAAIVLVTSGLVADDAAAIAAAKKLGVPIHVIGVGPAPARGALTQLAAATNGTVRFAIAGDDLGALARSVAADTASPPAPLAVTWGTLAATDVVPATLPRLGAGQAMLVVARVKRAQTANGRARGELFAIEALPAPRVVDGATTAMGALARRWARDRLDELLAGRPNPSAIAAHAVRYGLVSPYTSMVAIGDEVIVEGGVKRSIAVPVSVPAGMKWQAVKKETTVDTSSATTTIETNGTKQGVTLEQDHTKNIPVPGNSAPTIDKGTTADTKPVAGKTPPPPPPPAPPPGRTPQPKSGGAGTPGPTPAQPRVPTEEPKPEPRKPSAQKPPAADKKDRTSKSDEKKDANKEEEAAGRKLNRRGFDEDDDEKPKKKAKKAEDDGKDGDEDAQGGRYRGGERVEVTGSAPVAALDADRSYESAEGLAVLSESGVRKRWRISASIAGGLLRSQGDSLSLFTAGARLELGGRTMFGFEGQLSLVDGDRTEGRLLLSFARRGIGRYFEFGAGAGMHLGDGVGPAGSLSLRLHIPQAPRAAGFLRYDGALIEDVLGRRGENAFSLGVEYGF